MSQLKISHVTRKTEDPCAATETQPSQINKCLKKKKKDRPDTFNQDQKSHVNIWPFCQCICLPAATTSKPLPISLTPAAGEDLRFVET